MNTTPSNPDSVSSVNMTPLAPVPACTMRWIPAESATSAWMKPLCTR